MRRFPRAFALAFGFLSAGTASCPGTAQSQVPPRQISVVNASGLPATLNLDDKTEILVMASWCPVSRRLNEVLKDPKARPYLRGKRLYFLFDFDEFRHYYMPSVRAGEITQAQLEDYLSHQPKGPVLVQPELLSQLATDKVYFYDSRHPVKHGGFPSAYSGPPNEFLLNHGIWLTRNLGIPLKLKEALYAAHPLDGG